MFKLPKLRKESDYARCAGIPGDDDRCPVCDMQPCGCPTF